jgi:hypothetical protein
MSNINHLVNIAHGWDKKKGGDFMREYIDHPTPAFGFGLNPYSPIRLQIIF